MVYSHELDATYATAPVCLLHCYFHVVRLQTAAASLFIKSKDQSFFYTTTPRHYVHPPAFKNQQQCRPTLLTHRYSPPPSHHPLLLRLLPPHLQMMAPHHVNDPVLKCLQKNEKKLAPTVTVSPLKTRAIGARPTILASSKG